MPAWLIPAIISAAGAIGGSLSNRGQTAKSTQDTTTSNQVNLDPETSNFKNQILNSYLEMLMGGPDFTGYEASGVANINKNADLAKQRTTELLSSRGIRGPALDFAVADLEKNRFADITGFQNQIPLLRNQLKQDILGAAGGFFGSIPFGTTQTMSTKSTGTQPGNALAGGVGNSANLLAMLYGMGAFRPQPTTGG